MATGQPSAASVLAMAAPIPREPPVTRATPSCARGYFALTRPSTPRRRHPTGSPRRTRRRRCGTRGPAGRRAPPPRARAGWSRRRCCRRASMQSTTRSASRSSRSPTLRRMRRFAWWKTKRSMSSSVQPGAHRGGGDRLGEALRRRRGTSPGRPSPCCRRAGRRCDLHRAASTPRAQSPKRGPRLPPMSSAPAPSPKSAGGAAVVEVEHAAHEVGADDERVARAAGLEHAGGQAERGDEAGAGGADVERLGVVQAERVRDERRGVGHDLVGGRRRDEDEVDLVERRSGRAVERCAAGRGRRGRSARSPGSACGAHGCRCATRSRFVDAQTLARSPRSRRCCPGSAMPIAAAVRRGTSLPEMAMQSMSSPTRSAVVAHDSPRSGRGLRSAGCAPDLQQSEPLRRWTASARLRTSSLRYSVLVCSLIVCGERNSSAAISRFV